MTPEDRTAPASKPPVLQPVAPAPVRGLGPAPRRSSWDRCRERVLLWLASGGLHAILGALVLLLFAGDTSPAQPARWYTASLRTSATPREVVMMAEEREVVEEFEEAVYEHELVGDEPVLRDEVVETDDDLPYEESFGSVGVGGSSEGISDAPFEGPSNNGTIGMGGGAGGSFSGRGGARDLGSSGGGRAWQRSTLATHRLRLRVGDDETLPLKGMHASVRVDGFRARVVLDCYFENDRGQVLEGDFQVRLPGEATPHFLAFGEMRIETPIGAAAVKPSLSTDIDTLMREREQTWNQPREARMVARKSAARAYNETVRRTSNPDPALLEWSGAGVFHARVFPLQPGRLHRIVLAYDVDLVQVGDELLYRLDLPQDVPEVLVDIEAHQAGAVLAPRARGHEGHYRWWNPVERAFEVRLPRRRAQLLQGADTETGSYFALRVQPDLPLEEDGGSTRAVFLLDTSHGSGPDAYPVYLKLMEAILEQNRGRLEAFAVLAFDVQSSWWRTGFAANTSENTAAALHFAEGLALEGASDLAGALQEATRLEGAYDLFLLGDGSATWGERDPKHIAARLGAEHTLFAYRTGLGSSDDRLLGTLASATRGGLFSVTSESELAAAGRAHARRPWRIEGIRVDGGSDVVVGGAPEWLYPGQSLRIAGRGAPGVPAHTTISLRRGDIQRVLHFKAQEVVETPLAPRIYGEIATAQLERTTHVDLSLRAAYAAHFRVVGPSCSLLMLEREEDYERFGLEAQDHAQTILDNPVGVVGRAGGESDDVLPQHPREAFLAWLDGLAPGSEAHMALPQDLRAALERVDPQHFALSGRPLACTLQRWDDLPGVYREALGTREANYASVVAEAARREAALGPADALRVLSTLVEDRGDDVNILRDVAERAAALGFGGHAHALWRRVVDARPAEPHGYAMMGRALAVAGRTDPAIVCYEAALAQSAPARYGAFRRSTLFEYVHLLDAFDRGTVDGELRGWAAERLGVLGTELGIHEADLVIAMGWNTDRTDVDLHIHDPAGEHCYYEHKTTKMGGRLTQDVTEGYGPELFVLPKAAAGTYELRAHYFSGDSRRASGRAAVHVTIYRGWGRPEVQVERRTVLLGEPKEFVDVATIVVEAPAPVR